MNLAHYRKIIDSKISQKEYLLRNKKEKEKRLSFLDEETDNLKEVREIIQISALISQNTIATHISTIVTKALRAVFPEDGLSFSIKFKERRGKTEADILVLEDGEEFDIFYDRGFGVADIISFSLRVAYVLMDSTSNVIIVDEPFRNLDLSKHEVASSMIKELADNLGIQFIICTHSEMLKEYADKSFHVVKKNKISAVKSY